VALEHLFGFGHIQSDDFKPKKSASQFIKNVRALLEKHDVVIADKYENYFMVSSIFLTIGIGTTT